jgi:hypothetical protein
VPPTLLAEADEVIEQRRSFRSAEPRSPQLTALGTGSGLSAGLSSAVVDGDHDGGRSGTDLISKLSERYLWY